jgi:hypothetical protein
LLALLGANAALAESPATRAASPQDVTGLARRVRDGADPLSAIDALSALPSRSATDALSALLFEGLPDASTDRILERFGERARPTALDALERMARHRRPEARVRALRAIAAIGVADPKLDAGTSKLLAAALRDSDTTVRGAAASALGARFERLDGGKSRAPSTTDAAVVDVLLRAVARGVPEAARAAGFATPEAELPKLHASLTGLPLTAALDAYDAALARKTLSEAAKLDVIARLGEIATPATKTFLASVIAARRFAPTSRLQRALIDTEKRIELKPAATGGAR